MPEAYVELRALYERDSQRLQELLQTLQAGVDGDADRFLALHAVASEYLKAAHARKADGGDADTGRDALTIASAAASLSVGSLKEVASVDPDARSAEEPTPGTESMGKTSNLPDAQKELRATYDAVLQHLPDILQALRQGVNGDDDRYNTLLQIALEHTKAADLRRAGDDPADTNRDAAIVAHTALSLCVASSTKRV